MVTRFDDKLVEDMKALADYFIPYNYPSVSISDEELVNYLKFKELDIDGYHVVLHFNKHDYHDYYLETFQIVGKDTPFLPFCLVTKLVQRVLGSHNLSLVEVFKEMRKIYCWTLLTNKSGQPILSPYEAESERCNFEGFEYSYIKSENVHFY
jgi:hypothetical protein